MKTHSRTSRSSAALGALIIVGMLSMPSSALASTEGASQAHRLDRSHMTRKRPFVESKRRPALEPSPEVKAAVDLITSTVDGDAIATWSERGVPQALYGKLGTYGEASETTARAFLARNSVAFKLRPDLADLTLVDERQSPGGTHLLFQQDFYGVKVHNGTISVNFDRDGEVTVVGGDYVDAIDLDTTTPNVTAEDAHASLLARIGRTGEVEPALDELVVYADDEGVAHLAYHVVQPTADEDGAAETFEAFVDAFSGELIGEARDVNQYQNGKIIRAGNAMAATGNAYLEDWSSVPASAYTTTGLQGLTSQTGLVGTYADCYTNTQSSYRAAPVNGFYGYERSTTPSQGAKFDAVNTYYYVDFTQRYIRNTLGFLNVNSRSVKFNVNGTTADNSWYTPNNIGSGGIVLGSGGVDDGEDAEVVLHEYGHSIQDNQRPNIWGTPGTAGTVARTGAMGEGFGDYWACSITQHFFQTGMQFATTCMEWDASSYSSAIPPTIRSITSSKHYPQNVVGEVHADGEIWSSTLWQIRSDIGAILADQIILQSHFYLTSSNNTFEDGANAMLVAANAFGCTQAQKDAIKNRFVQRGILAGAELMLNGGFELGSAAWSQSYGYSPLVNNSASSPAYQGSWKASLLGRGTTYAVALSQAPTFPVAGATKTLRFRLKIDSSEGTANAYDFLYVRINSPAGAQLALLGTLSNKDKSTYASYQQVTFTIPATAAAAGNRLQFHATEDYSLATTFHIDNVSIQ